MEAGLGVGLAAGLGAGFGAVEATVGLGAGEGVGATRVGVVVRALLPPVELSTMTGPLGEGAGMGGGAGTGAGGGVGGLERRRKKEFLFSGSGVVVATVGWGAEVGLE